MEFSISATELARKLCDVLGRIRDRGDSFVVERKGEPVARIGPLVTRNTASVLEGFEAWRQAAPRDLALADDLDRVNRTDRSAEDPWDSSATPAR